MNETKAKNSSLVSYFKTLVMNCPVKYQQLFRINIVLLQITALVDLLLLYIYFKKS